jgi:hypothetical protein
VSREADGLWNNLPVAYLTARDEVQWKQAGCDHHRALRMSGASTSLEFINKIEVFCPDCGLKRFETYEQVACHNFKTPLMRPGLAA